MGIFFLISNALSPYQNLIANDAKNIDAFHLETDFFSYNQLSSQFVFNPFPNKIPNLIQPVDSLFLPKGILNIKFDQEISEVIISKDWSNISIRKIIDGRSYKIPFSSSIDWYLEKFIEKYIELNPNEANAYDSLAEFHLNKGEFDKAIENYQLAFEVDPEFEWATRNLALAKYQENMAREDVKVMQWTSESDEAKSAFNTGMWQFYNLEWEEANKSFSDAIEEDESFALAYAMRARTHFLMQNQSSGAEDLEVAVSMSLNATAEEKKMILSLYNDNELGTKSFNQVVERLVRKYPDGSFLRMESIFATMSDIGPDMILRRGKDLYAMNPNFTPALNIMGYAYMQKDEMDLAKETLQEQVRRQAGKANPYDSLGDYYLEVNDNAMALKYFEQSSKMGLKASESKVDSLKSLLEE